MQHQTEHDNFFYEYFPQYPYAERPIPCHPVQDYQLRELCPEKSKVVLPIPHPLAFAPSSAHVTGIPDGVAVNIPQSVPHRSNLHSNSTNNQPVLQATLQQNQDTHQVQNVITPDTSDVPRAINATNQSQEGSINIPKSSSSNKKKRTLLRHMINPEEWIRNKNKKARMLGQAYKGWIKTPDGKYILGAERKALECGPPCSCKRSTKGKELKCGQLSEKERKAIFEKTCSMSWEAKKVWVQSHVEALEPKKKAQTERHRTMSIAYYLPTCSGRRKRVCRNMFLSTLGRNRRQVERWIKEGRLSLPQSETSPYSLFESSEDDDIAMTSVDKPLLKPGEESKKLLRQKACLDKRKKARDFLDTLNKTSGHNSWYLDSNFKTGAALYKCYKESVGNSMCVSTFVFFEEMKTKRIKLLKRKKGTNHLRNTMREECL